MDAITIDEFYEIIGPGGRKYLRYHCDGCGKTHLARIQNGLGRHIRRAYNESTEVLLWCGRGDEPQFAQLEGLRIRLGVVSCMSKKDRKKMEKELQGIRCSLPSVPAEMQKPVESIEQMVRERLERVETQLRSTAQTKENLMAALERLNDFAKATKGA